MMNIKCIDCGRILALRLENLSKINAEFIKKHNIYICRKCKETIIGQKLEEHIEKIKS